MFLDELKKHTGQVDLNGADLEYLGAMLLRHASAIAGLVEAAEKVCNNAALMCDEEVDLVNALSRLNEGAK